MKNSDNIQIVHSGVLNNFRTLSDGTLKLDIYLNETTPEQSMKIFQLHNKFIKFFLSTTNIQKSKIDAINSVVISSDKNNTSKAVKSPSKKLKNTMYVYYKKKHGNTEGFDDWYTQQMQAQKEVYLNAIRELDNEV